MTKRRIRRGDQVVVIAGNDKGRTGKVLALRNGKILVEGINVRKKHVKKSQQNPKGQIVDIECLIDPSNVQLSIDGKGVKLKARYNAQKQKEYFYVESGKEVVYRAVKAK